MALLVGAAMVVLGLLATFAIGLSDNQASSKRDIEARVHERAVLAAALIETLFNTVQQQIPVDAKLYGGPHPSAALLQSQRAGADYLVLLNPDGSVIASSGLTSQARARLGRARAIKLVMHGASYALGDLLPGGKAGEINVVAALPTAHGRRLLVEGAAPGSIAALLTGELERIPGVAGSRNLILDANDTVIASNVASRPTGYRYRHAARLGVGVSSGERKGRYYDEVPLQHSTWRIVLESPAGTLFASLSGLHKWVPWLLLIAFGLVALVALAFGWRIVYSAEQDLADANAQLESVNNQLEATNARLERRAEELARSNAELDQFASIASHDLQEPLRKVRTFTEQLMVSESGRLSERGEDYLARANRAAERMQQLIQDLLQFSRVTTKPRPFTRVDLNRVAAEIIDDISVELEESDAILSVGTLPTLSADELQMRQLILNLLANAVKFRREGIRPEVSLSAETNDGQVRIVVADNGIGFEQQYAERIFRVFERLNGRGEYPGTGIGLALCQKIATRHGGEIVAEGKLGEGATFTVTLPLAQPSRPTDELEPNPEAEEETHVAG